MTQYKYIQKARPMTMVAGMARRPKLATYQVINTGPTPKAKVPAVLKMDMANPSLRPAYRGTMPVTGG